MGFFDKTFGNNGLGMRSVKFLTGGDKKMPFTTSGQDLVQQQDLLNRYNINSAEGSRSFTTDPTTGRTVLNITETPFQQAQRAQRQGLASEFLQSLEGGDARFGAESKRIGDLTFERGMSRLQPLLDQRRRSQEIALSNQGLPVGSEAQSAAEAQLGRNENDLLTALAGQSELAAGQEQSRLRNLASDEASSFFGNDITGGANLSFFGNTNQVDAAGIVNEADTLNLERAGMDYKRQENRRKAALDLGSKVMGFFSDIRVKEDIVPLGKKNNHNWYEFKYKGKEGRYRGVMAQDVEKIMPEAVSEINGIKCVNYSMLGLEMEAV